MSRATETRLRKLEAATEAARKPHIFIVEALEADERRAQINELVAAGLAAPVARDLRRRGRRQASRTGTAGHAAPGLRRLIESESVHSCSVGIEWLSRGK